MSAQLSDEKLNGKHVLFFIIFLALLPTIQVMAFNDFRIAILCGVLGGSAIGVSAGRLIAKRSVYKR
jgi:hypothetical protein